MQISISSPAAEGVEATGIEAFLDAIDSDGRTEPHGLIIHRHGRRIVEGYWAPHNATRNRLVYSLSKTFTGSALGLQIGEGRLALDDLVADHLPEIFGDVDERTAQMTIRNIASMATGHDREMLLEAFMRDSDDPIRGFFQIQPDAEPGSLFAYSQPPVLALAAILQRLAGERLVSYLRPRLLDPLGIGNLRWSTFGSPGIDLGFSGVYTCLDAVVRLGQLYLDDGSAMAGSCFQPDSFARRRGCRSPILNATNPIGSRATASNSGARATGTAVMERSGNTWWCCPSTTP